MPNASPAAAAHRSIVANVISGGRVRAVGNDKSEASEVVPLASSQASSHEVGGEVPPVR